MNDTLLKQEYEIQQQDKMLTILHCSTQNLNIMATNIKKELNTQSNTLTELEQGIDATKTRITTQNTRIKKLGKILNKKYCCAFFITNLIFVLFLYFLLLY